MDDPSNKRRFPRVETNFITELSSLSLSRDKRTMMALVQNLSQGGLFIETHLDLKVDDMVAFELGVLPNGTRNVYLGIVRWCAREGPRGVGVEFVETDVEDVSLVGEYVNRQVKKLGLEA